ncbi:uncharacterized protein LOC129869915 [Solanum dulcamara]|uniref:uncharacterized protein LOC129869915 n=1 Tax=Solanum dulcamara TaxID=45834 RepID=UPI00248682C6|nr:uncharacterized protein LOC129869915 [Solanum dulcamara]
MGFGQKWIQWVKYCILTVRFPVLINGLPARFFRAQRGLRQGDPLSAFLFLIAMKGLNSMIKTTNMNGWLRGFDVARIGEKNLEITHLQYADDTLILCDAEEDQLRIPRLWRILLNLRGISWTMPGKITEAIQSWEEAGVQAKSRDKWRIVPACVWWTIWKERMLDVLINNFLDLANICTNLEATVADRWSSQGWNFFFRRNLNDWEVGRFVELLQMIDGFKGTTVEDDTFKWKHDKDGKFSVSRIYGKEVSRMPENKTGPWKHVWESMAATKVKCFAWFVIRKACLTHEILQKKGLPIVSRCMLCSEARETNNHLFLHCKVTSQLWTMFLSLTETKWSMPEHTTDLLSCWIRRGGSKTQKKWWRIIPHCIWWTIWRERNGRSFEDRFNNIQKIKGSCIATFCFWCKEHCIENAEQLVDLLGLL